MNGYCTITNQTKGKPPSLSFVSMKNEILGQKYELSLVFVSQQTQRKLNKKYRNKDKTTNILSFPLTKLSGEITIDLKKAYEENRNFNMTKTQFIKYLFIHGCLHLKGFVHSSTMERQEKKFLEMFS